MPPGWGRLWLLCALLTWAAGCGDDGIETKGTGGSGTAGAGGEGCPPDQIEQDGLCLPAEADYPCESGELLTNGVCLPAGVQANGCAAGQVDQGSGCRPAGLPPAQCAESDDDGCVPLLPAEPCPIGELALPGETVCREVAPCGDGTWGDIVTETNTQFVNGAYPGGNSDGSQSQPWTTINAAMAAAEPGAIVAIAAGSYPGSVSVTKPLRLWGRCPSLVEIVASGNVNQAMRVYAGGSGSEVRDMAFTGSARGLVIHEATDVVASRVWLHDTAMEGFDVWDAGTLTLRDSLVERTGESGGFLYGAEVTVERTVIRDVAPRVSDGWWGIGIFAYRTDEDGTESKATVSDSLIERVNWAGVAVVGSEAVINTTVVRDVFSDGMSDQRAHGIEVVANTVTAEPGRLTLRNSVIERTRMDGVVLNGADGTIEATVVRDVRSNEDDGHRGTGIVAVHHNEVWVGANAAIEGCVVTGTQEAGIALFGASGTVAGTVVSDVMPSDAGLAGFGIFADKYRDRGAATVTSSRVERVYESGIYWVDVEGMVAGTVVSEVFAQPAGGLFGDGIAVVQETDVTALALVGNVVDHANRVAVLNVGGAVTLAGNRLSCSPVFLNGEDSLGVDFQFTNLGGNECGCNDQSVVCQVLSSSIDAPDPVDPPTL